MQISLSICNWLWLCFYVYFICYHVSPFIFVPLDYKLHMNKDCVSYFLCNFLHASYIALHCQCFINSTNWSSNFYSYTCTRCVTTHKICVYNINTCTVLQWHPRLSSVIRECSWSTEGNLAVKYNAAWGNREAKQQTTVSGHLSLMCSLVSRHFSTVIKIQSMILS